MRFMANAFEVEARSSRAPRVGLFIPCYIDQLYPRVGMATLEILEGCGLEGGVPAGQACCGQRIADTGCPRGRPASCWICSKEWKSPRCAGPTSAAASAAHLP